MARTGCTRSNTIVGDSSDGSTATTFACTRGAASNGVSGYRISLRRFEASVFRAHGLTARSFTSTTTGFQISSNSSVTRELAPNAEAIPLLFDTEGEGFEPPSPFGRRFSRPVQ